MLKKLHELVMTWRITPSATNLLLWILRRAKKNEICEIEIDLAKFNKYIESKRGKKYDRKTLRNAIAQLDERTNGIICILKSYGKKVYKLLIRPLNLIREENPKTGKNSQNENAKPMYSEEQKEAISKQQQQSRSTTKAEDLLAKLNIKFDRDGFNRLWKLAGKKIDNLFQSVELLLYRHQTKEIPNPQGFLIDCLKYKWYEGFDPYYELELPKFETKQELIQFSTRLREEIDRA